MKDRLNYRTHFYMDFHWQNQYVGILEAEMDGVKYYFIDNEYYFNGFKPYGDNALFEIEKFAFFSKAALSILPVIDFRPDLIHCHDWQTGLVPVYLHERFQADEFYRGIKTVMTIHNLKFQGIWDRKTIQSITGLSDYYFTPDKLEFKHDASYLKGNGFDSRFCSFNRFHGSNRSGFVSHFGVFHSGGHAHARASTEYG